VDVTLTFKVFKVTVLKSSITGIKIEYKYIVDVSSNARKIDVFERR